MRDNEESGFKVKFLCFFKSLQGRRRLKLPFLPQPWPLTSAGNLSRSLLWLGATGEGPSLDWSLVAPWGPRDLILAVL